MSAYELGALFGRFMFGCICGLFPLIVAIVKKHAVVGVCLLVACGLLSFLHPVASLAVAVVSGIVLLVIYAKK